MPNRNPGASAPNFAKKLLRLPHDLASSIAKYRHAVQYQYERDAYERLLRIGLEAEQDRLRQHHISAVK